MDEIFEENVDAIIDTLEEFNCCKRCTLRFIYQKSLSEKIDFLEPQKSLELLRKKEKPIPVKRMRTEDSEDMCRVCLGILEDSTINRYVEGISNGYKVYEYENFVSNVGLPRCVPLRNRSMYFYLKQKFPNVNLYYCPDSRDVADIKRVFKTVCDDFLSKKLNRVYDYKSRFTIDIRISYDNDEEELKKFKTEKSLPVVSHTVINKILCDDNQEAFEKIFPIPPDKPQGSTSAEITFKAETMFLGGRYLKFVRNIGQTPWVINGRMMTEDCVQDIIFDGINKILGSDYRMTFTASGREDSDVRMLGEGRPFYVQVEDPKSDRIATDQLRRIEEEILASRMVGVMHLQLVDAADLKQIKDGEQEKRKTYRAVCHTMAPDLAEAIDLINRRGSEELTVLQRTPLRVLHRRTLFDRPKVIKSMRASAVPGYPDLIDLSVVTQAGTYVKEFVNGDFRRTKPSLASLIGYPIDVVALDVTEIQLKWP